jgi:NitT/TauT family transport system substrate-binding protein
MNKTLKILLVILVTCLSSLQAYALETVKVAQFGKEKFLLYLPFYIAMEKGYFAEQGIAVDLTFAVNDDQIFAAVASKAVDFGIGDPVFTAIAAERGFPAKTVALMIQKLAISGYTNQKNIPVIDKAEQLAGLRIGSFPKPSTTFTQLAQLITDQQPMLVNTKIVQAGMGTQLGLLLGKQVDIAIDLEPTVSKLEEEGYRVVFDLTKFSNEMAITGLTTRQDMISGRPKIVQGMVTGLQKALALIQNQPQQAVLVAQKLFPKMKPQILERSTMRIIEQQAYPATAVIPNDLWQRSIAARLSSGELKKPQATEIAVDNQFALQAAKSN